MDEREKRYSGEYVEIRTSLEHIRTRLENMDQILRDIHDNFQDLSKQVDQNRTDLAGIKATAAIMGGLAGSLFAVVSKWLFLSRT